MTCNNCGSEVQDGMKFCGECGTPVPQTKKMHKLWFRITIKYEILWRMWYKTR